MYMRFSYNVCIVWLFSFATERKYRKEQNSLRQGQTFSKGSGSTNVKAQRLKIQITKIMCNHTKKLRGAHRYICTKELQNIIRTYTRKGE